MTGIIPCKCTGLYSALRGGGGIVYSKEFWLEKYSRKWAPLLTWKGQKWPVEQCPIKVSGDLKQVAALIALYQRQNVTINLDLKRP